MTARYRRSHQWFGEAQSLIPTASQTFSKSHLAYPDQVSPLFIESANGCRVLDPDGNEYIDLVSGLLAISLGYQDADIDAAVVKQMQRGVTFSLPHRLEYEAAERLVEHVPCAEQVRFGKNGTDVTSAAIRLARAYTGRERVAMCGYHGWQDWSIGTTSRDVGVPKSTAELTTLFSYNDLSSLENLFDQYPDKISAVVMEPMTFDFPDPGYLAAVKSLVAARGALLIFDEMITGFRFSMGGAQSYFGVTPDLATFGKGMANGYPLSALVGRKEIMALMDRIFYSGTFGGETLSLAAAKATIDKMARIGFQSVLAQQGNWLLEQSRALIDKIGLSEVLTFKGHPSWTLLQFHDHAAATASHLKSFFIEQCLLHGVLIQSSHNLSHAHTQDELSVLLRAYETVFQKIKDGLDQGTLAEQVQDRVITPIFNVRTG